MGRINREWHEANRMPRNPTDAQRVAWHAAHARHCACRALTPAIIALMRAHGVEPPSPGERAAERG